MSTRLVKRFRLVSLDEGGARGITNPRLVCRFEGGGTLVIWGGAGRHRANIDRVLAQAMPCVIECECHEPSDWAKAQYGHLWWVPENAKLEIVTSE